MENIFSARVLRLKEQVQTHSDKDVARLLGLSDKAFSARKMRDSFPEKELLTLPALRPDLRIDVNYVLTGERSLANIKAKLATSGERVRRVRDEMAMSVAAFASHLGVVAKVVTLAEAGNSSSLNELLSPLATKCVISPMWLLSGELPVLDGDLSPFEVFVIERYRLLGPQQRTALRACAAEQLAIDQAPAPPPLPPHIMDFVNNDKANRKPSKGQNEQS